MSKNKGKKKNDEDDFLDDILGDVKAKKAAEREAALARGEEDPELVAAAKAEAEKKANEEKAAAEKAKLKAKADAKAESDAAAKKAAAANPATNARIALIKKQQEERREYERQKKEFEDAQKAEIARIEAEAAEAAAVKAREAEERRIDRERRRAEGTLLTKAQREKQQALERQRAHLLASGLVAGAAAGAAGESEENKPKRVTPKVVQKTKAQIELERIAAAREKAEAAAAALRERAIALVGETQPAIVEAYRTSAAALATAQAELKTKQERAAELKAVVDAAAAEAGADAPAEAEAADSWEEEVADEWDAEPAEPAADEAAVKELTPAQAAKAELETVTAEITALDKTAIPAARAAAAEAETVLNAAKKDIEARLIKEAEAARKAAEEAERAAAAAAEEERMSAVGGGSAGGIRAPIVVILGHVDSGKTSLLDRLRNSNVAKGEAGGITQQIGATNIPAENIRDMMEKLTLGGGGEKGDEPARKELPTNMPGMLMIDTPGHESFSMLRQRGSSMCDLAILIVDVQKGLQQQTLESIEILKSRNTPFIVAVTKVDALYGWPKDDANFFNPIRQSLSKVSDNVTFEFEKLMNHTFVAFAEQSINVKPFWEFTLDDMDSYHPIVPVSSKSGEGIPDLLSLIVDMSQTRLQQRLAQKKNTELQCTVLEVKSLPGHGTVLDVILINGQLKEEDMIVCAGLSGPVCTRIRSLLIPPPLKESRVKTELIAAPSVRAAIGCKISAPNLSGVLAGSSLFVCGPRDDLEDIKDRVQEDLQSVISKLDMNNNGVFVHASSLGSLEALLTFLAASDIPVSGFDIGTVSRASVTKTSVQLDKHKPEYAVLLAFDVKVDSEAAALADRMGVKIFDADVIYTLGTNCVQHFKAVRESQRLAAKPVYPVVVKQMGKNYVFHNSDPLVCGVKIVNGSLRVGTPLFIPREEKLQLGRVTGIRKDDKPVDIAHKGDEVSINVDQTGLAHPPCYGRHFDDTNEWVSYMTSHSTDDLLEFYNDELTDTDVKLIAKFKELKWIA